MAESTADTGTTQGSSATGGNLGPKGRRQRRALGLVFLGIGLGGLLWIALADPPRGPRFLIAIPFFVAGLGLFQAQAST